MTVLASLMENIFDIAKRERQPDAHHHRLTDDLRADFEAAKERRDPIIAEGRAATLPRSTAST